MPLFPEITPFKTGRLPLTDGHTMHYELSGNKHGTPVVFLHGGPGDGLSDKHHRYANPKTCLSIAYSQRGCGQSKPLGSLKANTTAHLVADLERLRTHLKLESWVVFGTSWGSTLALAYAQAHPKRVKGLVVGGVFLGTQAEIDWFAKGEGCARFAPLEYRMLLDALGNPPPAKRMAKLYDTLRKGGPKAKKAAIAWSRYALVVNEPAPDRAEIEALVHADPLSVPRALLGAHYQANGCFLKPNQLLNNVHRIAHIPLAIVQGGNDMVCPPESAYALHAAHPDSTLVMVPNCGHSANAQAKTARVNALRKLLKRVG